MGTFDVLFIGFKFLIIT